MTENQARGIALHKETERHMSMSEDYDGTDDRNSNYDEYDNVDCLKETERAVLVSLATGTEHWVPKSQLSEDSEVQGEGDHGTLLVTAWFTKKEGW